LVSYIKRKTLNRVLRRIFGTKMGELIGEWRKFHSDELHNLYSSPKIIRTRRMIWEEMNAYRVLLGSPEGKRPLGKPKRRWKDDLREIGWGGMGWIRLAQYKDWWMPLVSTVMNLLVP
jgi:hypothetical protein